MMTQIVGERLESAVWYSCKTIQPAAYLGV